MTTNQDFYKNLKSFTEFNKALDQSLYKPVPEDWFIVIADIKNSTIAIENDKYKDVNIIGASCIIAVLNTLDKNEDIPFVFGGDGATFTIPQHLIGQTAQALANTRIMAKNMFDLELRIGIVPITELNNLGKKVEIAKYQISEHTSIAMFSGGGLSYADNLIKNKQEQYSIETYIDNTSKIPPDFSGLECRWNPVKATKGEMLTLMVQATNEEQAEALYKDILEHIKNIYGNAECYQPNNHNNMSLTFDPQNHKKEMRARTAQKGILGRTLHRMHIYGIVLLGTLTISFERAFLKPEKRAITNDLIQNTDFQKFDDVLRMVIDSRPDQTKKLEEYLLEQHKQGRCIYGTHISDDALITCMIFDRKDRHLHFIDGASGGYALAAKKMKEQVKPEKRVA